MSDTSFDGQGITAGTELILSLPAPLQPASLFTPTPEAARRVLEFFTAHVIAVLGAQITEMMAEMKAGFSEVNSRIDTLEKVVWRVIWPLIVLLAVPIFGLLYRVLTAAPG